MRAQPVSNASHYTYGAITLAGGDGIRQPLENEIKIARFQRAHVTEVAKKQGQ